MRGVYLLHFEQPYRHAGHYLGWSANVSARLAHHAAGTGANLPRVVKAAGIGWTVARTWKDATRTDERRLKRLGSRRRVCPICRASGV